MGILDRLKKTRQDDDDEDSQDVDDESDDEDLGSGGLWGRFGAFRGIGGNAAGMLGKVLKRGGDDEDDDEDEISGGVVARPAPAVATSSPGELVGESVVDFLAAEPDAAESPDEDEPQPLAAIAPRAGTAARVSAKFDIFSVRIAVDPSLKDLAMSQDAISAQELAADLEELVYRLSCKFSKK